MTSLLTGIFNVIAYVPFRDPLHIDAYWMWMMIPLVIAVSVVYKTIKIDNLSQLPLQAAFLALQIVAFMVVAAAVLWGLTEIA